MINFCTLFDSRYLSRGLLMIGSLVKHEPDVHIYIVAFDDLAFKLLTRLNPEKTTIISLEDFENDDLLSVKKTRTTAEYCWTCTSSVIEYIFARYNVSSCTYIDADLYFYSSPGVLLKELGNGKDVLVTEHRFSRLARLFEQKRAGRFCVQFITFLNNPQSRAVLRKWISQCIEWCYARYEDGKFGDQKYLDSWPAEYPNVHILENHGGGIAPWNARQYAFEDSSSGIKGTLKNGKEKFEVIFFHFHFVRFLESGYTDLGWNRLSGQLKKLFYEPYIRGLLDQEKFLQNTFHEYRMTKAKSISSGLKESLKYQIKKLTGFNLIKLPFDGLSDRS